MTRRDLLKLGGLAAAGLILLPPLRAAQATAQMRHVIVDPRFAATSAFAAAAMDAKAQILHSHGDLATLWYGALREASSGSLMGLTGYADMVVALGIAAEMRGSLRFCMTHQTGDARAGHSVSIGPAAQADVLKATGEQWPHALWTMMSNRGDAPIDSPLRELDREKRKGVLWSWAIA
ncbi:MULTISPECIES: hypothetical protein [Sphingobium]|uniref:hypothetical protein n=1 Tax=Sphingobium TaxID=165695 RepID=UPI0015ECD399|nr:MULTISPECIES: hypothetical protein [Sphingobium]MCW2363134.1 hypothetical protein [Sphingobium sp. B10D3B]MCW2400186.1 hypothetical protein [Sphingobium sp. B10D7B]MCW2407164.1 hypothetical protein [Sphingobium xanthum]